MAYVFKRSGSKRWQAAFYVKNPATGELEKVRFTTGKTNRKEAQALADEQERLRKGVVAGGTEQAMHCKLIMAQVFADIDRSAFTTPTARAYVSKLLEIATGEDLPAFTVKSWFEEWIRRKARGSSDSTMARYRGHVRAWLEWLGESRAAKPLEGITAADARAWRDSLQDAGRTGKTVLSYTKDINAAFRAAIREGLIQHSPFGALDVLDTSDSLERKPFSGEEVARLLEAAPSEEWRGLILVAAFTGLRLGDAARLRWSSVDLDAKRITLIPSKTKKKKREVRIPIQPDLHAYLLAAPVADDSPDAPVFPTLSRMRVGAGAGLSQLFVKIMEAAGVDRGKRSRETKSEGSAGRTIYERGFHSLRHTFVSWLRTAGVSEEDRMALSGHTTRESHQIYSHADEAALRQAIAKLPTIPKQ